jgi:hypothetical protein
LIGFLGIITSIRVEREPKGYFLTGLSGALIVFQRAWVNWSVGGHRMWWSEANVILAPLDID